MNELIIGYLTANPGPHLGAEIAQAVAPGERPRPVIEACQALAAEGRIVRHHTGLLGEPTTYEARS